ncbi:hypothetical protein R9C00_03465 [Flammeovirgaceae bacterium SG7u.111]|nr:hypothetical protein [Flammeovirgaceae bacterium SG7u.132]WPO36502.1 hypothetical protein R9C00_03465 [Flammeovirgaceae bacterium SG7u.111]
MELLPSNFPYYKQHTSTRLHFSKTHILFGSAIVVGGRNDHDGIGTSNPSQYSHPHSCSTTHALSASIKWIFRMVESG